jgi:hypothetical protein
MAAPNTLTAILKNIQSEGEDPDVVLARQSALFAQIKHEKDFHSNNYQWSVAHSGLGGGSHDATTAEANDVNGAYALFSVTSKTDYSRRPMQGTLVRKILEGGLNEHYVDYLKGEINLSQETVAQNVARGLYASSTGRRGVRGSVSGDVLTLATPDDAFFFSIGDKVQAAATDGGSLRDTGDYAIIIAVDTTNGKLTSDATKNWAGIAGMSDGDSLYRAGDENVSYNGLGDIVPATAPTTGDAVFGSGVDRSINPDVLAGVRLTTTGSSVETVLIRAMAQLKKRPGSFFKNAKIYCSEEDFASIQVAKEGSRFIDEDNEYGIGINTFMVGTAPVVPDVFCPTGTFFILGEGAVEFHSNAGIAIDATDGNQMRKTAGDTYTLVALTDSNFVGRHPGACARGSWPTG